MVTAILLIHLFNLIKVARWNIQKHSYYTDFQLVFPNSHTRVCFKVKHGCFICLNLIKSVRWNIQQQPGKLIANCFYQIIMFVCVLKSIIDVSSSFDFRQFGTSSTSNVSNSQEKPSFSTASSFIPSKE
jgi:hypothetical protein